MVEIAESYLLLFISAVFIPLFIFLVKMIIEQGKNSARLDQYDEHLKETKGHHTTIELIRQRLEDLERDVKDILRYMRARKNHDDRDRRYGDRDSSYFPDGDIADHGAI